MTGLIQPRLGDMSPRRGRLHASLAWQSTPREHRPKPSMTGLIQPRPGDMSPGRGRLHDFLAWQSTPRKPLPVEG